ncbi:uncharacterized protein LOC108328760 [Vigna angularis]|uniref:uncharacterized protein LOC108328760 n=1 Tax=Phaseolus angularis TaxID=3914 RepID=UPI00080A4BF5|nr:uncharacterized protein LOC108328760 [Vigna angularis]
MFNHRTNKAYTESDCPYHCVSRVSGGVENCGSSICDHGGVFRNESAALHESLQTQSEVNAVFIDHLRINNNKNQFLPKRSSFPRLGDGANNVELERCLSLPDGPSNYRTKLRGGNLELGPFRKNRSNRGCLFMVNNGNGVSSSGSQIQPTVASDGFQNPYSEPDTNGSQSQFELNMKDYLNRSYIEDNDFICDFDNLLP